MAPLFAVDVLVDIKRTIYTRYWYFIQISLLLGLLCYPNTRPSFFYWRQGLLCKSFHYCYWHCQLSTKASMYVQPRFGRLTATPKSVQKTIRAYWSKRRVKPTVHFRTTPTHLEIAITWCYRKLFYIKSVEFSCLPVIVSLWQWHSKKVLKNNPLSELRQFVEFRALFWYSTCASGYAVNFAHKADTI